MRAGSPQVGHQGSGHLWQRYDDNPRSQCRREEIMALHPNFPTSPYEILDPAVRWFPADEALREQGYEKLLPPLVATLRSRVKAWRDSGYQGASPTSQALLRWWFQTPHIVQHAKSEDSEFR